MLESHIFKAIFDDFKHVNETSEAINLLKIITNFACATQIDGESKIIDFIRKIYVNPNLRSMDYIIKANAIEFCKIKHLKHLWIAVMLKSAVLNSFNSTDIFELGDEFKVKLSSDLELLLNQNSTVSLLSCFYQLIKFYVVTVEGDEMMLQCKYSIRDVFSNIEAYNLMIDEATNAAEIVGKDVKLETVVSVWNSIVAYYKKITSV
jgi:hypothetical protein